MANKKISAFDTITTIPGGPITLSDVLGVAGYCDDPLAPGTDVNVSFSGADIITATEQGLDSVLGVDDTAVNKDIILSDGGFNQMTLDKDGLDRNNAGSFTWSGNGLQTINNTGCPSADLVKIQTSNLAGCDASILINSRSPGTGKLKLKTATDIQVDLPVAPTTAGDVLTAKNLNGDVEWAPAPAQKFVLTLAYAFDQTTTTVTTRNLAWDGNVNMSGATSTSVDDGSWYVQDSFKITKVIARYAGRTGISMGGTDSLVLELKYLTPSSTLPNSWSAVSNAPASPAVSITDFGNNLDLALADNGTYPFKTFTPGAPITINADTMLVCTATESSSIAPTATDYFLQIFCEYV